MSGGPAPLKHSGGLYRRQDDRANRGQAGSVNFETHEYSVRWPD
jgi:hypothetical protein